MRLTGAQILVQCLLEQGVDTVFGYPGGAVLYVYDALYESRHQIRHILTCHEQGAAHAADGYARSTGKTGVVIATSGPGATNLVTGIATAYMDSVPMVAITGNVARGLLGRDSFQEVDITGITMPVTKHNVIVRDIRDLAPALRQAFQIAQSGRPGPVLVDIPKDITAEKTDYEPVQAAEKPFPDFSPPVPSSDADEAVRLISESKRPFIFAGGGVTASGAQEKLLEFSRRIDAPVSLSLMGLGNFPAGDPSYTGLLGMHGSKVSSNVITECDLLIAIGTRFSDRVTCNPQFARHAKILHMDIDAAEINKNVAVTASMVCDAAAGLDLLLARLPRLPHPEWLARLAEWKVRYPIDRPHRNETMPYQVMRALHDLTDGDLIVSTEVGQHQIWAAQYYPYDSPRRFLSSGGLGTMGYGLGAAIGAQAANPGRRVVNIAGDGSFYMNLSELATAVRFDLPVIELIMNNGVLGMVRQWQKLFYESRFSQTTLDRQTDIVALAQAFGAEGFTIHGPEDIVPVLRKALSAKRPCVINCLVNIDENVLPMVPAGASVNSPILEM